MRDRSRNEKDGDYRLPVLLVLGLFICALHLTSLRLAVSSKPQESKSLASDTTYAWLAGENIRDGLYRLPRHATVSQLFSFAGVSLCEDPEITTLRLQPFSSVQLKAGGQLDITGLHPRLAPFFFQPIPINQADVATLTTIPGIGPVLAKRIIAFRDQKGGIHKPRELLAVKGIGKKKLAGIRREVRFN